MRYYLIALALLASAPGFAQAQTSPKQQAAEMQALQQTIITQLQAQIALQTKVNMLLADAEEAKTAAKAAAEPKPDAPK